MRIQADADFDELVLSVCALCWAGLPAEPASVTAYDAVGRVVASHQVRACTSPVDCEVR